MKTEYTTWKCHTPALIKELFSNIDRSEVMVFALPFKILMTIIEEVARRASELNDPELNDLMCRLTLYEIADPYSQEYDPKKLEEISKAAKKAKRNKKIRSENLPIDSGNNPLHRLNS